MQANQQTLLDDVRGTSSDSLATSVAAKEGISQDDEDGHKRKLRSDSRKTFNKLRRWFYHFLFFLLCGLLFLLSGGFIYLLYLWVGSFIGDPVKIGSFLGQAAWSLLLIFATLFFQGIFGDKDN